MKGMKNGSGGKTTGNKRDMSGMAMNPFLTSMVSGIGGGKNSPVKPSKAGGPKKGK